MRHLAIATVTLLLGACGQQYIPTATYEALIVVSDIEETSQPEQKHALVHYSLPDPPKGDPAAMHQTERVAFDCQRNMSLSLSDVNYPIKSPADETPVKAQWKAVGPNTHGASVLRVVCRPTAKDKPTIKPVRSIERDWREFVEKRRAGKPAPAA